MALDPLTALSVAGTVIQFADFGMKLFQRSGEIYNSTKGTLSVNEELERITTEVVSLVKKLSQPLGLNGSLGCQTNIEYTLAGLCNASLTVAQELLGKLDSLKVKGRARVWKSVKIAISHSWNQDERNALAQRLQRIKELIEAHVLSSVRYVPRDQGDNNCDYGILTQNRENIIAISMEMSIRFNSLDSASQTIVNTLLDKQKAFSEEIAIQTLAISQLLNRSEVVVLDRLEQTRIMLLSTVKEAQRNAGLHPSSEAQVLKSAENEKRCRDNAALSLLEALRFSTMTQRQEEVVEAYRKTFEWIFRDPVKESRPWASFVEWLRHGKGI